MDNKVKSPCQSICILDEGVDGLDYCIGCFRTVDEIQHWYEYTDEEKLDVIGQLEKREEEF